MSTACCSHGAWGELKKDADYVDQGVVEKAEDMNMYRVGESNKCILWNYDIFGFDSGRTRQLADSLANKGFMVIIPDYYRGKWIDAKDPELVPFLKEYSQWDKVLKKDLENIILPYAKKHGASIFGSVGTCWGTYLVVRLSAYPDFVAGVGFHPSHSPIIGLINESEEDILKNINAKAHLAMMPAKEDHPNVKNGGLMTKILNDRAEIHEFSDMEHGWTTRGDLTVPSVERDVKKAMMLASDFFEKYLK